MHRTIWHCTLPGCEVAAVPELPHVLPYCSREAPPVLPRPVPCAAEGLLVGCLGSCTAAWSCHITVRAMAHCPWQGGRRRGVHAAPRNQRASIVLSCVQHDSFTLLADSINRVRGLMQPSHRATCRARAEYAPPTRVATSLCCAAHGVLA